MKNSVRGVGTVIGLAAIGPAIVGIVGFVAAIFAISAAISWLQVCFSSPPLWLLDCFP